MRQVRVIRKCLQRNEVLPRSKPGSRMTIIEHGYIRLAGVASEKARWVHGESASIPLLNMASASVLLLLQAPIPHQITVIREAENQLRSVRAG